MQSWIFSIITPVFREIWSFRNHDNRLIWCIRNIHNQCWKRLFCDISLWKRNTFLKNSLIIESPKEQHLFETESFCNTTNLVSFISKLTPLLEARLQTNTSQFGAANATKITRCMSFFLLNNRLQKQPPLLNLSHRIRHQSETKHSQPIR